MYGIRPRLALAVLALASGTRFGGAHGAVSLLADVSSIVVGVYLAIAALFVATTACLRLWVRRSRQEPAWDTWLTSSAEQKEGAT